MALERLLRTESAPKRLAACLFVASMCFVLNGCEQSAKTRQTIDQRSAEAQQSLATAQKKPSQTTSYDPLMVSNKVWSGSAALRMQRGMPLPSRFEISRGVTLVSSEPMSLADIANAISAQTGIPVRMTALTIGNSATGAAAATGAATAPATGAATSAPATPVASATTVGGMPVSYEGPLSGLLDRTSAYFGVSWRYDGSSISISRYETRIFVVEAMPGSQEINEGMQDDVSSSNGSSGSSGGSGSSGSNGTSTTSQNTLTQNSKTTINLKYWDELAEVLKSIVSGQGSIVTSPTMGTVTITTTPDVMATVADYLSKENKRLSRQIAINVQIYSVNLQQSEDFNIAMKGFINHLTEFAGVPGIAANEAASSFGSLGIAIIPGTSAHPGANEVFSALSAIGDTTQVAQFPMTTLNNRPVSRRVGTDTTYIATVNSSTTTSTSTTQQFTPVISTVHDGFSLQLTPRLLDDGRILLQYSLSLIGIDTLGPTTFNEGGGVTVPLSLPITDNRIFVQQSMLRSGQTLVIGGVDQEKLIQNKQGVGSPDNFLLGGGVSSANTHLMMFMAITPQVMDLGDPEHN